MSRSSKKAVVRVSSVQQLARTWRSTPEATAGELIKLVLNKPVFSYAPLYEISKDLLRRRMTYEQAVECIGRMKRPKVRSIYSETLPLIYSHFSSLDASFVHSILPRTFGIGQNIFVPFNPVMLYGNATELVIPWLSMWKTNPVKGERLALFASIVNEVLREDTELDRVRLEIVDLSAPPRSKERILRVTQLTEVAPLAESETMEMLSIYAEGFRIAESALRRIQEERIPLEQVIEDRLQLGLDFDGNLRG